MMLNVTGRDVNAPKTKHLLWRICKNCLPTRSRLQERHVPCPMECPLCNHSVEDEWIEWHILFNCNDSIEATKAAGLEQIVAGRVLLMHAADEVIMDICRNENKEVAMLVWFLWNNRNKVWNDEQEAGQYLGHKARQFWQEWHSVQALQQNTRSLGQEQSITRWQKPPLKWYKCNVDAGFHNELNKTSAGWILRDCTGQFVVAGSAWNQGKCSIIEGEAIALLEAMKEMEQRGITHVIFETDSRNVVDAIHNLRFGSSEFSAIICNIRNVLSLNSNFVVKFIKRQANMVAHTLARAAASRYIFDVLPLW